MKKKQEKDLGDELKDNVVFTCPEHSLETYFKVKELEKSPEAKDFVYVRFYDGKQHESMWVKIHKGTQLHGYGEINNVPVLLTDHKLGEIVHYTTDKEGVTWQRLN